MMNKKGQVLVVFILLLPLILGFLGLIIDISNSYIEQKKLENTIKEVVIHDHDVELIKKNIQKNVKDFKNLKVNQDENIIYVEITKEYKSIFKGLFNIGNNNLKAEIKYDIENNKIIRE